MVKTVRLHKAIADAGLASRRAAEEIIASGRVAVNGEVVTAMGVLVDPDRDEITVDGEPLPDAARKRAYLLYKPRNVICTRSDPEGRKTIFDILPDEVQSGLHTAGRLDYDAEGIIVLTNDGELTQRLTHPGGHIPKTYVVKVRGRIGRRAVERLRRGVDLEDGRTLPAEVKVLAVDPDRNTSRVRIVLREGRRNQIKRMGTAVGHPVLEIMRTAIGPLQAGRRMKAGTFRRLSPKEIENLKRY
ncbi:MAG: rRNA pseudouridine synthase [bacterium]|nr:MAG: rRNA pseudouridine synthase [bacterium]